MSDGSEESRDGCEGEELHIDGCFGSLAELKLEFSCERAVANLSCEDDR
jgi:hypothetical protein